MSLIPQPSGRFWMRTTLVLLTLTALALGGWLVQGLAAPSGARQAERQAPKRKRPRVKEVEETPPPKRKVIRIGDSGTKPKPLPSKSHVPASGTLREAARVADHVAVKRLFEELAVPYDLVTFRGSLAVTVGEAKTTIKRQHVEPLPVYVADRPERLPDTITLLPLDDDGNPGKPHEVSRTQIASVDPYELIGRNAVHRFLAEDFTGVPQADPKYLSRSDQLLAAEKALAAVVNFHDSARSRGVRKGKGWAPVEEALRKELLDVLRQRLTERQAARDWNGALGLARRMARAYPGSKNDVARPLAGMITAALRDGTAGADRRREVLERLRLLEDQFPESKDVKDVIQEQVKKAQRLYESAQALAGDKKTVPQAEELLRQAEDVWPYLPGLGAYRTELTHAHPVLRVGMRELPKYMSPARATTDAELRAAELLFESLVKFSPDAAGVARYQPGLAEGRPRVISLGRRFRLPRNAAWSDGHTLNGADVRATVRHIRDAGPTGPLAPWASLLEGAIVRGDPFRVDVTMTQGYLDPLSLMTFKVLPQGHKPDTEEFAQRPVGSGPYRFDNFLSEAGHSYARFVANPNYGSRPSKFGLPRIREIRFFAVGNPVKEFKDGNLNLALGLTAKQAAELREQSGVTVFRPGAATPNRRVYFLAVNQGKPHLNRVEVRRALAFAINREKLLNDHFRAGQKVHKALNGPFPAGCWACNPTLKNREDRGSLDPYDPALARTEASGLKDVKLQLKYPSGDPAVFDALSALRDQVRELTGIELELVERDPRELVKDVEVTQNYELAYFHHDFPDETYRLGALLGPDNYLKYRRSDLVANQLQQIRVHRHFEKVRGFTHALHTQLLAEMPLIPLWQLDLFSAARDDLETVPFDPIHVFTDVDQWKFKRK